MKSIFLGEDFLNTDGVLKLGGVGLLTLSTQQISKEAVETPSIYTPPEMLSDYIVGEYRINYHI